MKKLFIMGSMLLLYLAVKAQSKSSDSVDRYVQLNEVVISANKFSEKKKNIAQKIDIITRAYIERTNAQNTGDLLLSTGNIFVQKSQQGGSSPVVRGFEASRVLLVIDGVRMNNLIYRSGHLQNAITIDQNMLESVEVLYGPASTLFGSDALGGVIHFRSKSPMFSTSPGVQYSGTAFGRYSSVNNEKTMHMQLAVGGRHLAWLHASSFSDFEDTRMGSEDPEKYPGFGRRKQYVDRINGIDSVFNNPDDRVQKFSGYKQWDFTEKLLYRHAENATHKLNMQFSNTSDVPRYDRLQDMRNGTLRYAEWYYGPQLRWLSSYEYEQKMAGIADRIRVNLNYQQVEESRNTREYRRYDRFDSRKEKVKVAGFVAEVYKSWLKNELTFGIDGQFNWLKSMAERKNINTGTLTALDTRYPDGKNRMNYVGVFAQHLFKIKEGRWLLNDGMRLQKTHLLSTITNNSFFQLPYTSIAQDNFSVTGNVGIVYQSGEDSKIAFNVSSGFRAPNVDDLSKIFESSTAAKQVVVPNPDIRPEYTYNVDIGFRKVWAGKVNMESSVFYTWFKNVLIKAPFLLNGNDSIDYNGVKSQVLANQNRNKAMVMGVSGSVSADFTTHFSALLTVNYTAGHYETNAGELSGVYEKQSNGSYQLVQKKVNRKPLDHIPPLFGKMSLQYRLTRITTSVYTLFNGWKRLDDYNADGEDNVQYATAGGMPAWFTLNWQASLVINAHFRLQLAVENLLDRNYRYFASGFSAPGRNFLISARINW